MMLTSHGRRPMHQLWRMRSGMLMPAQCCLRREVSHLSLMPQGQPERERRALAMVQQMDDEGFGNCTVTGSCEAACPKEISLDFIARLNREYGCALVKKGEV